MTTTSSFRTLGLLLTFLPWLSALAGEAGTVVRSVGTVSIKTGDGVSHGAAINDTVSEGDIVITATDSEALIRFKDNSAMTLRPGTQVAIVSFKHKDAADDSFVATLFQGALRSVTGLIGKTRPNNVRLKTSTATIGIRGTDFEVAILAEDGPAGRAGTYDYVYAGITSLGLMDETAPAQSIDTLASIPGNLPDLRRGDLPSCRFLKRCERAQEDCVSGSLPSKELSPDHSVRCFHPL